MADYRQDCMNPSCRYNGYNSHSPDCYVAAEADKRWREQQEKKQRDAEDLYAAVGILEDDSLITYYKHLDKEIGDLYTKMRPLEVQKATARQLIRDRGLVNKLLEN